MSNIQLKSTFRVKLNTLWSQKMKSPKVLGVIQDVNMGTSHVGLKEIATAEGLKPEKLQLGEMIIFVNPSRTAFKVLTAGNMVAYQRSDDGTRLNAQMLAMIPHYFGGSQFALPKVIETQFSRAFLIEQQ